MKKNLVKIYRNRILWSVVGILLVLYVFMGMHGMLLFQRIGMYFDGITPVFLGMAILLTLYISGMVKDFLNGFRIAFARKGSFPAEKIRRAVTAFRCAEQTAVAASAVLCLIGFMDMLSSFLLNSNESSAELYFLNLNIPLGILSSYAIYPALFLLILTPVKTRLTAA